MIVVTGATGRLGRLIVEELLRVKPARGVGVSVRDPERAADLAELGVRVRRGDFEEASSLDDAFEGAEQILLVSSNARASGGDAITQHRDAIAAARRAGARRLVYTSHMGASARSAFPPMHDHAATEELLAESGIAWTALRNGFYAATVPQLIGDALATGTIEVPADGKVAWTAHADLATAAVRVLLDEGRFDGATPPLTAGEALDLEDVALILSGMTSKTIGRRIVSDDEQAAKLAGAGLPSQVVDIALALYAAARAGEFDRTDPTLAALIGRTPVTVREMLAGSLQLGGSTANPL